MNTSNLSQFGYRELDLAGDLLKLLGNGTQSLATERTEDPIGTDGLSLEFNPNSGFVFLTNDDCQVWMENEGKIEMFLSCPECGLESLESECDVKDDAYMCGECGERI